MKLLIQNAFPYRLVLRVLSLILIRASILVALFFTLNTSGCKKDDLGKCTIKTYSGDQVYDDISIEECQNIFYDTPGVRGWKWEPNR